MNYERLEISLKVLNVFVGIAFIIATINYLSNAKFDHFTHCCTNCGYIFTEKTVHDTRVDTVFVGKNFCPKCTPRYDNYDDDERSPVYDHYKYNLSRTLLFKRRF